jgi:SNF2 family DNA or RNA helicase
MLLGCRKGASSSEAAATLHKSRPEGFNIFPGQNVAIFPVFLFFSPFLRALQFTQILDILRAILRIRDIKFLILTGSTPVDVRQTLVDEFTEDESIPIFLLSTKAGGSLLFL